MVTLDDGISAKTQSSEEILALDAALEDLKEMHPRQAQLVEVRFFGGFNVAEAAELLQVSESTVERDWRAARAWLAAELRQGP